MPTHMRLCVVTTADSANVDSNLQAVVEDKDLTDALRRTFLLPNGKRRQGLTLHDKQQGLILFLLTARRKLEMRMHQLLAPDTLLRCIVDAVRAGCWAGQLCQPAAPVCPAGA